MAELVLEILYPYILINLFAIGLVQVKCLKNVLLYAGENVLYFNEDSGNVAFSCNEMGILNLDFININLDNTFDKDNPDTIILIRLLAWHIGFEKCKALKKELNEELMQIPWHPIIWWSFFCQKI